MSGVIRLNDPIASGGHVNQASGSEFMGIAVALKGLESVKTTVPTFDKGAFKRRFQLHSLDDPDQILPGQKFRLTSSAGQITEGVTDAQGHSSVLDGTDLETFKMELIHD